MNNIDLQKMRDRIRDRRITAFWAELRGNIFELVESYEENYGPHVAKAHDITNSSIIVTKQEGLHVDGFHSVVRTAQVAIDGRNWKISGVRFTELVRDGKSTLFGDRSPFTLMIEADVDKGSLYIVDKSIVDEKNSRLTALEAAEKYVGTMLLKKGPE